MIYLGVAIAALGSGLFLYDYTCSLRKTARSYKEIYAFLIYIRGEIDGSAKPITKIACEYFREKSFVITPLANALTTPSFRDADISELAIDREDGERLSSYFEGFGSALSKQEELRRLNALILPFEKKSAEVSGRVDKRIKSLGLIYAAALLSTILLIV